MFGSYLWSNEVDNIEKNNDENNVVKIAQSGGKRNQIVNLIPAATVNPSEIQTRVKDNLRSTMKLGELHNLKGTHIHVEQGPGGSQQ